MTGKKKKKVDFSVRPRAAKDNLPPDPDQWVRGSAAAEAAPPTPRPDTGLQKRLTLNLPAGLHTAFKGRCVVQGVTIQDKVRELIERELAGAGEGPATAATA
ncbi:MAG TPA: plasmid partition protein ParG [Gemmataceae bacterium]|nr:plasmid partition protein ParG [Gemmataceae bacterium]